MDVFINEAMSGAFGLPHTIVGAVPLLQSLFSFTYPMYSMGFCWCLGWWFCIIRWEHYEYVYLRWYSSTAVGFFFICVRCFWLLLYLGVYTLHARFQCKHPGVIVASE